MAKKPYYLVDTDRDLIDLAFFVGRGPDSCWFTALRYVLRAGEKPGSETVDDLRKAIDVLERWLAYEEQGGR